ncbi:MAG: hypothetical protein HFE86_07090 [Clostridiales bacterium]|nr:hypothetical protein [Clostridiales bacterium]
MSDMRISGAGAAFPRQNAVKQQADSLQPGDTPAALAALAPSAREKKLTSLYEMIRDAREQIESQKKRFQIPKNSMHYGDAPMQAYARLARARNRTQVNAAAGYARRCIAQFKAALRQDSENADQIRAAIHQLQKAINRAGKKKRDLERERLAECQRARYERDKEFRQAQRVQLELRRRRSMRAIREHGYIREAEVSNRFQEQMAATRTELKTQAQTLSGTVSVDTAVRQYTAQTAAASAAPSPAPAIDTVG